MKTRGRGKDTVEAAVSLSVCAVVQAVKAKTGSTVVSGSAVAEGEGETEGEVGAGAAVVRDGDGDAVGLAARADSEGGGEAEGLVAGTPVAKATGGCSATAVTGSSWGRPIDGMVTTAAAVPTA